ncbi:MAG: InlB B-repeat-containing protein [Agathobacter sp.]|nr:InlB B-repeat-containing protein [Agathobacter sp.]
MKQRTRNRKRKLFIRTIAVLLLLCMTISLIPKEEYEAASFTNAMEFYHSISKSKKGAVSGGDFYIGTQARLASSSTNLKYQTLGYDFTLIGSNGAVASFSAVLGGSMQHLSHLTVNSGGFQYNLYMIPCATIITLAKAANSYAATQVFQASSIAIYASAIITTKQNGICNGYLYENGAGGVYGANVYHLRDDTQLAVAKSTFSGHTFGSYINIYDIINNHKLNILYDVGDGATVKGDYSEKPYIAGNVTVPNALHYKGSVKMDSCSIMQTTYLTNTKTIGLEKTGYHLEEGKEWKNPIGYPLSIQQSYTPVEINPRLTTKSAGTVLRANWVANEYTVKYDINAKENGQGEIESSEFIYDQAGYIMPATYTRRGYKLVEGKEWNTKPDGTGISYASGQEVLNMTAKHNDVITLYAQWEPCIYKIIEDKAGGTGGTDVFYQKYNAGFYAEEDCVKGTEINRIVLPTRTGYNFLGYYNNMMGIGGTDALVIGPDACIMFPNNTYAEDTTIFAIFEPKEIDVIFDKQGGLQGDDTATAVYDQVFPAADAPYRPGYSFKGYFTEPDGHGEQYYNEFMSTDVICKLEVANITLYAHWVDETAPVVKLGATTDSWTDGKDANGQPDPLKITVYASDSGVGLARIELYQEGVAEPVAVQEMPNEKSDESVIYTNVKEGVVTYKAVAYDKNGNRVEAYKSVKYDTQAPIRIKVNEQKDPLNVTLNETYFGISINISDKNIQ